MSRLNLIFDLDGTLVDSIPGIENTIREAVLEVTGITKFPAMRQLIGPPLREILQKLFPALDPLLVTKIESRFRTIYDIRGWKNSIPFPGIIELLENFYNYPHTLFIATFKPETPTRNILAHIKILSLFTDCYSPDSRTPEYLSKTEMLQALIRNHSLEKRKTIYIGDQPGDEQAARDCDILFVGVLYGYGNLSELQYTDCCLVESAKELEKTINQLRAYNE